MKTSMIAQARYKDRLVDLGAAGCFGFETEFTSNKRREWPCVYVLNTAAENTVEVDRRPTWLEFQGAATKALN
jgi:hypothetical protein